MKILQEEAITFDDVTLVPNYSTIKSRSTPSVGVRVGKYKLHIPIIASPMNTVCEYEMADVMMQMGADSVIHRYMTIADQIKQLDCLKNSNNSSQAQLPFFAVGATGDYIERTQALYSLSARKFCIDVANGDSEYSLKAISSLKLRFPDIQLMAGNVCTQDGFMRIAENGADLIRVGVGSGAMCKTRVVTGHGVPQLTALMWAAKAREKYPNVVIVSDGGTRSSGDVVKALALADCVMLGSLLAGTTEAPGAIIKENGEEYKLYAGMASEDGRSLNNWFDREKTSFIPEGESVKLKYKGSVKNVIGDLVGGLRVGMSYAGAFDLRELKEKATFIKVSNNGKIEGTAHGK